MKFGLDEVSIQGPKVVCTFFEGTAFEMNLTETVVISWGVIALITVLVLFLTHNMSKIPSKKQAIAEWLVTTLNNLVESTMGKRNMKFAPYMATIFCYSIFGSFVSLIGLRPATADINTIATWALLTFLMIQITKIKASGFLGFLKSFTEPVLPMTPMNIMSEFVTPISMSFRHFGNIAAGMIITQIVYYMLTSLSRLCNLNFPIFTIGLPAALSVYFDLFSGFMQAFIFVMLSMVFIGSANEPDENAEPKKVKN